MVIPRFTQHPEQRRYLILNGRECKPEVGDDKRNWRGWLQHLTARPCCLAWMTKEDITQTNRIQRVSSGLHIRNQSHVVMSKMKPVHESLSQLFLHCNVQENICGCRPPSKSPERLPRTFNLTSFIVIWFFILIAVANRASLWKQKWSSWIPHWPVSVSETSWSTFLEQCSPLTWLWC